MGSTWEKISSAIHICFAFWVALLCLPLLVSSFVGVRITKHFWLKLLSSRYPQLEFVKADTIRSLLDTHRNQGIINVLLCVKGAFDPEIVKCKLLDHVINKRDKFGEVMFPKMRASLVSCWGNYAWDTKLPFRIENHFIVSTGVFRGRPITDSNIQEYISDIVSKYFPTDQPPWQFILIPCHNQENKYYVLVRVHHLLLTGKKSINIGDLLLIEQSTDAERINTLNYRRKQSPLAKLFPTPSAIPELYAKIGETCSNMWNEFVSEYDPVESPRAMKSPPGAVHCAGLALVIIASALREVNKRRTGNARDVASNIRLLITALRHEFSRRELTIFKILSSPLVTLDPRKWPARSFRVFSTFVKFVAILPLRLKDEIAALKALKQTGHPVYPNTMTWRWAGVGQLAWRAAGESCRGSVAMLRAPAQLWEDSVRAGADKTHALQTASLCGRKVTAWSRAISRGSLERAATALDVSDTDIMLYAAGEALGAYFQDAGQDIPGSVLMTARIAKQDFLYAFAEGDGKDYKKSQTGGMVCISLPIGAAPRRIASILSRACQRQSALASAWAAQARCGALTRAVPSPMARLALNALSRRYAVSYAEISAPPSSRERNTTWGHQVEHVVYWRPPQANISLSLTAIQYADTVCLAVMSDARLSPHHAAAAMRWPNAIEELITRIDHDQAAIESSHSHASNVAQRRIMQRLPATIHKRGQHESETRQASTSGNNLGDISRKDTLERSQSDIMDRGIDEVDEKLIEPSTLLKPPPTQVISPPPVRRRISHE